MGDAQVRVDRLARAVPARGQAIGGRQERHVHLDRRTGEQVAEHRPPGQRLGLVDEKAQSQVVTDQRRHMGPQAL